MNCISVIASNRRLLKISNKARPKVLIASVPNGHDHLLADPFKPCYETSLNCHPGHHRRAGGAAAEGAQPGQEAGQVEVGRAEEAQLHPRQRRRRWRRGRRRGGRRQGGAATLHHPLVKFFDLRLELKCSNSVNQLWLVQLRGRKVSSGVFLK